MKTGIKPFNKLEILDLASKLEIKRSGTDVKTLFAGNELKSWTPKDPKYKIISWNDLAESFIDKVSEKMEIKEYSMKMNGGIQELKLHGDPITINDEEYKTTAILLNSSDGTRKLRVYFGVWRTVGRSSAISDYAKDEMVARHVEENDDLETLLKFDFKNITETFDSIVGSVGNLNGKTITLQSIRDGIITDDGKNSQKFLSFCQKLISSKTDRMSSLTSNQIKVLKNNPRSILKKGSQFNIDIPAPQAFNCYMELFRAHDSGVVQKETERFLKLI